MNSSKGLLTSTLFTLSGLYSFVQKLVDLKLWHKQPATQWVEALLIGNGHIGAMIFGGVERELLHIN